ncbi:MAG: PLP-dependent aminotransferase family protein [Chloroflexi bacterium]|nr:PLP-dependent aminotransferase family protein [Chloroflexota bacterium]
MATVPGTRWDDLLSSRAQIGWTGPKAGGGPRVLTESLYEFGGGLPDPASFPHDAMLAATARMLKEEGDAAMTYGEAQGYLGLRKLICHKYELFEDLKVSPDNILVANGSGNALSLAFSAFVDIGDPIITEAPTFSGTLQTIRRHGAEVHSVPVDQDGIVTSAVREQLESITASGRRCKLIYTIVNFQNPSGPTMSLERRKELVALAAEYDTLILEDDAYGELRFEGHALPSIYALDPNGRTIRAGTLSKILGAGVRLGWLCAPAEMIPALQSFLFGGGVNPYMSRVATYFLRDHMEQHVKLLIDIYRNKRDAMLRGLREHLDGTDAEISVPEGGFFIWIKLPTGTDTAELKKWAAEESVEWRPGTGFMPNGGGEEFARLAYSYESVEKCYAGGAAFGKSIRAAMG